MSLQFRAVHPEAIPNPFVPNLDLQPLTAEWLPAAINLDQKCFGGLWSLAGYQRELESPNSTFWALFDQTDAAAQRLIGLGCYWSILEEAHITILAIDPTYQHQGLGKFLLLALLATAHKQGLERATLEVRISNQSALNLYQKFGFREAGRRKQYYQDTGEDAAVLWLNGLEKPDFVKQLLVWQSLSKSYLYSLGWQFTFDWNHLFMETF
jgi:ribosomal-protein-alanine N-acetyltransferase